MGRKVTGHVGVVLSINPFSDFCPHALVLPTLDLDTNGISRNVVSRVWIFRSTSWPWDSLARMCGSVAPAFLLPGRVPLCAYTTAGLSISWAFGYFQLFAVTVPTQAFVRTSAFVYLEQSGTTGSQGGRVCTRLSLCSCAPAGPHRPQHPLETSLCP